MLASCKEADTRRSRPALACGVEHPHRRFGVSNVVSTTHPDRPARAGPEMDAAAATGVALPRIRYERLALCRPTMNSDRIAASRVTCSSMRVS